MAVELRHLRCLVAVADEGTLTDAGIALGLSQAAVSRTLAALERDLGVLLVRRTSRETSLTPEGAQVLARARRLLADTDDLVREATTGQHVLRVGHAWSALGRHTLAFQRRWAERLPGTGLQLVRTNSPTAGLAEGTCRLAVLRVEPDPARYDSAVVGLERRFLAVAADDPWARRRSVRLAEVSGRVLLVDSRTGSTTTALWPPGARPATEQTEDIDDWLAVVATGRCVGITAEATVQQYPRPGVVYRPVADAAPVVVRLAWWRGEEHPATATAVAVATDLYRGAP
ncbi:LysR family transcriptional regulator [Aquipuribacter hungaricus]|uniref:LysR family transcriptional regulator n=1 Tax=Aquipuribacter hungaricus TaxID=545624 RepID=A0ABV7WKI9_9MICO